MSQGEEVGEPTSAAVWQLHVHEKKHVFPPQMVSAKIPAQSPEILASRASGPQKGDDAAGKSNAAGAQELSGEGNTARNVRLARFKCHRPDLLR